MGGDNRASNWMERRAGRVRAKKERAEKKAMIEEDPNKIINGGHRFLEREREMGQFREREKVGMVCRRRAMDGLRMRHVDSGMVPRSISHGCLRLGLLCFAFSRELLKTP